MMGGILFRPVIISSNTYIGSTTCEWNIYIHTRREIKKNKLSEVPWLQFAHIVTYRGPSQESFLTSYKGHDAMDSDLIVPEKYRERCHPKRKATANPNNYFDVHGTLRALLIIKSRTLENKLDKYVPINHQISYKEPKNGKSRWVCTNIETYEGDVLGKWVLVRWSDCEEGDRNGLWAC